MTESTKTLYWGEAEWRASRRLRLSREAYQNAAAELWGRNMSAERDARAAASVPPTASPATRRAHRGRITRLMDDEVRQYLAESRTERP